MIFMEPAALWASAALSEAAGLGFDLILNVYDKSIIDVENRPPAGELSDKFRRALARVLAADSVVKTGSTDVPQTIVDTLGIDLERNDPDYCRNAELPCH